jgi:thioredoxin-like negative regulator of GroEL
LSEIIEVDAGDFKERVLRSHGPIILEFYSHGCPHCQVFSAVYARLNEVMGREMKFARLDVLASEDNRQFALSRGVRGVPTMELFYNGRVICSILGNHPFDKMVAILEESLRRKDENVAPHTLLNELS